MPPTDIGPNEPSDDASGDITGTEEPVTPPSDVEEDAPPTGDMGGEDETVPDVDQGGSTEEPVTPPSDVEEDAPDCGDEGDLNVDMGGSVTVNPPASETQTSEPAPVQQSAPADPAPAQESAPVQETAPVQQSAPADPAPAQESAPVQEEAPAQEISYDVGGEAITEDDLDW